MKIFPVEKFEIETTMPVPTILAALGNTVEPRKWKWFRPWFDEGKKFEGRYSDNGFKIMRILNWRNSFQPVIVGTFCSNTAGTTIKVTMRLHRFVAAFMCAWMGFPLFELMTSLKSSVQLSELFGPLVMIIFGVALVSICFWTEVKKSKPLILEFFSRQVDERTCH